MTEDQLLVAVLGMAKVYGWRSAHFRPAQTQRGRWITAVQGDGKGFPDVCAIHGKARRAVFAELKAQRGHLSPEQSAWLETLKAVDVEVYLWRPSDLLDGTIEAVLRVSPEHRAAALR